MTARGVEVIEISEPGPLDSHGDPLPGTSAPAAATGCIIWPRTSSEDAQQGRRFVEGLNVYVPPGEPVPTSDSVVTARGDRYDVDGVPGRYVSKRGEEKGVLVVLARAGAQGGS